MPLAGESQLPCPLTPHSLDKNIEPVIFPLSKNDESAIGRPTGLFTTSRARGYDLDWKSVVSVSVVDFVWCRVSAKTNQQIM